MSSSDSQQLPAVPEPHPSAEADTPAAWLAPVLIVLGICLLTVLALGLLLSALPSAREAALRTECQYHLRQLAIGVHLYHEQQQALPTAGFWGELSPPGQEAAYFFGRGLSWRDQHGPLVGVKQPLGWGYQILPYLQYRHVWQSPRWSSIIGIRIPEFVCPGKRSVQSPLCTARLGQFEVSYQPTDYAAVDLGMDSLLISPDVFRRFGKKPVPSTWKDVSDGTSCTILLAEKHIPVGFAGKWHPGDRFGYASPYHQSSMRRVLALGAWVRLQRHGLRQDRFLPAGEVLMPVQDAASAGKGHWRFGTSHPRGFCAAFCDVSVRQLDVGIDPLVWFHLAHPRDGHKYQEF